MSVSFQRAAAAAALWVVGCGSGGVGGRDGAALPDGASSRDAVSGQDVVSMDAPADATAARPTEFAWDFEQQTVGMQGPSGTRVADRSGSGLDGTSDGALAWVRGELADAVGAQTEASAAVVLDGARAATVADAAESESFRLEVGFRTDVHGQGGEDGGGTLVAREAEGEAGFRLSVEDGRVRFRVWSRGGAPSVVTGARLVSDDRWHRVTAVRDRASAQLVLILDGTGVDRSPDGSGALASSAPITAFRGGGASPRAFVGALDSVRFVRARIDAPPAAPERAVSQVFLANHEAVPGGGGLLYAAFRLPAIVRTSRGTLLAFAEARVDDPCDFGDIDIVMKRSTDGGATWSSLVRVVNAGSNKAGNPVPIVAGTRVALLATIDQVTATCNGAGSQRFQALASDDDGATWSAPRDVTAGVRQSDWGGMLLGPGHGIRLEQGPNAGTLVVAGMHHRASDNRNGGQLLASDDGVSWRVAASENDSPVYVNESTVAELSDGSLLVNTRDQRAAPPASDELLHGLRGVARATPALAYAHDPAFARTADFRGPVVEGSSLAWPGSARFGDERRVLFSYPAGEHGSPAGTRHDLRVYASRDDGATWGPGHRVVGPWAAYSDLVALGDGTLGVLHEAGIAPGAQFVPYQRLDFARLGVEALDERTLVSFGFEQRAAGDAFGTVAGAGVAPMSLRATGTVALVAGRHSSTAARFDGASRACTTAAEVAGWLDFGRRDSFAVEATFRTTAHDTGGANASGTLVSRTDVNTQPAWWLRIEDGRLRFLVASCDAGTAQDVNCGVMPGTCAGIGPCTAQSVTSPTSVSDGAWHHVRAVRDAAAGQLVLEVDGARVAQVASAAGAIVKNEEPLCVGAFSDGSRAFHGDVDGVRVELVD